MSTPTPKRKGKRRAIRGKQGFTFTKESLSTNPKLQIDQLVPPFSQPFALKPIAMDFSSFLKQPLQPLVQQDKPVGEMVSDLIAEVLIVAGRETWKKASPDTFAGYQLLSELAASPYMPPEFKGWFNAGAFLVLLQGGCDTAQFIGKELKLDSRH